MVKFFLIYSFIFASISAAIPATSYANISEQTSVQGFIKKSGNKRILISTATDNSTEYELVINNQDTLKTILKLSNSDFISGSGSFKSKKLSLESIDFIGLNKLIGSWKNKDKVYNFKNYTDLQVFNFNSSNGTTPQLRKINYKYSIAPYEEEGWAMFLTANNQNYFTVIQLDETNLKIIVFDPNTGLQIEQTELKKSNSNLKY